MKLSRGRKEEPRPAPQPTGADLLYADGLLAAWYVARRLDEELARARRCDRPLAVLLTAPHLLAGEELPGEAKEAAAAAAMKATRRYDLVGWLPSGEIMVLMPETNEQEAATVADRLRNEMFLCASAVGGHKWVIRELLDARAFETSLALIASVIERPIAA